MAQARVDNSLKRTCGSFLSPDLLILDDLGLHRSTAQQSADLHDLILHRHGVSSFIITSNRAVDEWLGLLDDPTQGTAPRTGWPTPEDPQYTCSTLGRTGAGIKPAFHQPGATHENPDRYPDAAVSVSSSNSHPTARSWVQSDMAVRSKALTG